MHAGGAAWQSSRWADAWRNKRECTAALPRSFCHTYCGTHRMRDTMNSTGGTWGLCTSYTPGPRSLPYPPAASARSMALSEREFSMVRTSAEAGMVVWGVGRREHKSVRYGRGKEGRVCQAARSAGTWQCRARRWDTRGTPQEHNCLHNYQWRSGPSADAVSVRSVRLPVLATVRCPGMCSPKTRVSTLLSTYETLCEAAPLRTLCLATLVDPSGTRHQVLAPVGCFVWLHAVTSTGSK